MELSVLLFSDYWVRVGLGCKHYGIMGVYHTGENPRIFERRFLGILITLLLLLFGSWLLLSRVAVTEC